MFLISINHIKRSELVRKAVETETFISPFFLIKASYSHKPFQLASEFEYK
jgi:hypothetical protein